MTKKASFDLKSGLNQNTIRATGATIRALRATIRAARATIGGLGFRLL